jgi:hypothetical protein
MFALSRQTTWNAAPSPCSVAAKDLPQGLPSANVVSVAEPVTGVLRPSCAPEFFARSVHAGTSVYRTNRHSTASDWLLPQKKEKFSTGVAAKKKKRSRQRLAAWTVSAFSTVT